jgi:hypothetical protein
MRVGGIVRRKASACHMQVFNDVHEDWCGLLLKVDEPTRGRRYLEVVVSLSSHGGAVKSAWLTASEIEELIEVVV